MRTFFAAALMLISCQTSLSAEMSLGEQLERRMWDDMVHRNFRDIEETLAEQFQSVHTFGAKGPQEELEIIKDLYLGSYEMSDVTTTETPDTVIVTYSVSVSERIDNKQLSATPAPRLSVWKKIDNKWKWIAHANLKQVATEQPKATSVNQ